MHKTNMSNAKANANTNHFPSIFKICVAKAMSNAKANGGRLYDSRFYKHLSVTLMGVTLKSKATQETS